MTYQEKLIDALIDLVQDSSNLIVGDSIQNSPGFIKALTAINALNEETIGKYELTIGDIYNGPRHIRDNFRNDLYERFGLNNRSQDE